MWNEVPSFLKIERDPTYLGTQMILYIFGKKMKSVEDRLLPSESQRWRRICRYIYLAEAGDTQALFHHLY